MVATGNAIDAFSADEPSMKRAPILGLAAVVMLVFTSGCSTTKSAPAWMGDIDSSSRPGLKPQNDVPKSPPKENWNPVTFLAYMLSPLIR